MITKSDIALARDTIARLNRLNNGSPEMVKVLSEVFEEVRTSAYNAGFSKGTSYGAAGVRVARPQTGTEPKGE